ncbi:hypothetical protein FDN03_14710 [Glutamicibacter sp. V16R2B1]|nr:hypothetical protein FDN03_14710 [Glutamicibacter sp. V16R2B1]
MPKPFRKEFGNEVVRVGMNREAGVSIAQVAKDFGVHVGPSANGCKRPASSLASSLARRSQSPRNCASCANPTGSSSKR